MNSQSSWEIISLDEIFSESEQLRMLNHGYICHIECKAKYFSEWWRHDMEPPSPLLALCEGNLPVTGWGSLT